MAIIISDKIEVSFCAADFLVEAIDEFLQSGANPKTIGSSIIKIAIGTELLLKEKLEKICPALILDTIGKQALQVAKLYELHSQMIQPQQLESVDVKTVSFEELLNRANLFFKIGRAGKHLQELQKIRNRLVHHRHTLDMAVVNFLIINKIVPFLQRFTKDDPGLQLKLSPKTWKTLRVIANTSSHDVYTQLAKRIETYAETARNTSKSELANLLAKRPVLGEYDALIIDNLLCPACRNLSMTAASRHWQTTYADEFWQSSEPGAICKVCGLGLDEEDVELYLDNWNKVHGAKRDEEKKRWRHAFPGYLSMIPPPSEE